MSKKGKIVNVNRVFLGEVNLNTYFKNKFINTYENLLKNK